jgi:hypothetical protein
MIVAGGALSMRRPHRMFPGDIVAPGHLGDGREPLVVELHGQRV